MSVQFSTTRRVNKAKGIDEPVDPIGAMWERAFFPVFLKLNTISYYPVLLTGIFVVIQTVQICEESCFLNSSVIWPKINLMDNFFVSLGVIQIPFDKILPIFITVTAVIFLFIICFIYILMKTFKRQTITKWVLYSTKYIFTFLIPLFAPICGSCLSACIAEMIDHPSLPANLWGTWFFFATAIMFLFGFLWSLFLANTTILSFNGGWDAVEPPLFILRLSLFTFTSAIADRLSIFAHFFLVAASIAIGIRCMYSAYFQARTTVFVNAVVMGAHTAQIFGNLFAVLHYYIQKGSPYFYVGAAFLISCISFLLYKVWLSSKAEKIHDFLSGDLTEAEKRDRFNDKVFSSEAELISFMRIGICTMAPYFLDFSFPRFAIDTYPNRKVIVATAHCVCFFPEESKFLGYLINITKGYQDLSFYDQLLVKQIKMAYLVREGSSVDQGDVIADVKKLSTEMISSVRSFWLALLNSRGIIPLENYAKIIDQLDKLELRLSLTLERYPSSSFLTNIIASFLIDGRCEFNKGASIRLRALAIENGSFRPSDSVFRSLVNTFPSYLLEEVIDIRGSLVRTNQPMVESTADLSSEIMKQTLNSQIDHGQLRMNLERALKHRKSESIESIKFVFFLIFLAVVASMVYFICLSTFFRNSFDSIIYEAPEASKLTVGICELIFCSLLEYFPGLKAQFESAFDIPSNKLESLSREIEIASRNLFQIIVTNKNSHQPQSTALFIDSFNFKFSLPDGSFTSVELTYRSAVASAISTVRRLGESSSTDVLLLNSLVENYFTFETQSQVLFDSILSSSNQIGEKIIGIILKIGVLASSIFFILFSYLSILFVYDLYKHETKMSNLVRDVDPAVAEELFDPISQSKTLIPRYSPRFVVTKKSLNFPLVCILAALSIIALCSFLIWPVFRIKANFNSGMSVAQMYFQGCNRISTIISAVPISLMVSIDTLSPDEAQTMFVDIVHHLSRSHEELVFSYLDLAPIVEAQFYDHCDDNEGEFLEAPLTCMSINEQLDTAYNYLSVLSQTRCKPIIEEQCDLLIKLVETALIHQYPVFQNILWLQLKLRLDSLVTEIILMSTANTGGIFILLAIALYFIKRIEKGIDGFKMMLLMIPPRYVVELPDIREFISGYKRVDSIALSSHEEVIHGSRLGVICFSKQLLITKMNRAACLITGLSQLQSIGQPLDSLFQDSSALHWAKLALDKNILCDSQTANICGKEVKLTISSFSNEGYCVLHDISDLYSQVETERQVNSALTMFSGKVLPEKGPGIKSVSNASAMAVKVQINSYTNTFGFFEFCYMLTELKKIINQFEFLDVEYLTSDSFLMTSGFQRQVDQGLQIQSMMGCAYSLFQSIDSISIDLYVGVHIHIWIYAGGEIYGGYIDKKRPIEHLYGIPIQFTFLQTDQNIECDSLMLNETCQKHLLQCDFGSLEKPIKISMMDVDQ